MCGISGIFQIKQPTDDLRLLYLHMNGYLSLIRKAENSPYSPLTGSKFSP